MTTTADDLVQRARQRIFRVGPRELATITEAGGLVVDIRSESQRSEQGEIPGAVVVERNVLEWRLDPGSEHRAPGVSGFDRVVVVVCSQGYASSLAAAALRDLGYERAGDLVGGYEAWSSWFTSVAR